MPRRTQWFSLIACFLLIVLSVSCDRSRSVVLPPCAASECDCTDFDFQEPAQHLLDAIPDDPYQLDGDGNGTACDRLPNQEQSAAIASSASIHLSLGNPSGADASNPNNFLLEKPEYVLSYNRLKGTANWASWQLNRNWLGSTDRQDDFRPDMSLPSGWYLVRPGDYTNSGYDRGHLVASADRTRSQADNSATFVMTNMIPQAPDNNRGAWRELEEYARSLVDQGQELYVIAGAYGTQERIGDNKITAPSRVWKVIIVLPDHSASSPVSRIKRSTPVIAVDMPNRQNINPDWHSYQVSVDQIEVATGYDLFSNVPPNIQAAIEQWRDR